jgi:hypothetical protein
MKFSLLKTAEAVLALAALGLLAALVVPWRESPLPPRPNLPRGAAPSLPAAPALSPVRAEPDAVLALFVPPSPPRPARPQGVVEQKPPPMPEKKPVDAPWLSYLGYTSAAEGKATYYFKDTRSGRVIKVTDGESVGGWSLLGVKDNRMILQNKDDVFSVRGR